VLAANSNGASVKEQGKTETLELTVWLNQTKAGPLGRLAQQGYWPIGIFCESPRSHCSTTTPLTRGNDLADHVAEDVGQPEIAAGMSEGQALVAEAEEMQHRRVQVVGFLDP
jgi:hypothetical protein